MSGLPAPADLRDRVAAIIRRVVETEILPRFRNLADHEITEKTRPGDLVTAADLAAEAALERNLLALLPGSVAVGEEAAEGDPAVLDALSGEAPVWVLDPVDGTRNFARGNEAFAVIVALVHQGETVAGWIHAPCAGRTVWAHGGQGAWQRDGEGAWRRLALPPARDPRALRGSVSKRVRESLGDWPGGLVRYFCAGLEYVGLADATIGFGVYGGLLKPWDHAAGCLIHREAGGYGALIETGGPYPPVRIVKNERLLLAPDAETWQSLRSILAGR